MTHDFNIVLIQIFWHKQFDHVTEDLETLRSLSEFHNLILNQEKSKILCVASKVNRIM